MNLPEDGNGGLLANARAGDNAPAQSVSELSQSLKRTIETSFGRVRVRGEISGFKRHASGHCYFGLKDDRKRHRWISKATFPIWLYVSVTGVVVYLMLYQIYPPREVIVP